MIRAVIVEDEARSRATLEHLIQTYCTDVEVVAAAADVRAGVEAVHAQQPDLLFLDVEMPCANGFDLLERIAPFSGEVIFTTAYDQYALRAIKCCALDYLLKPIDIDELQAAISKARERQAFGPEQVQHLLANLRQTPTQAQRVALPTSDGLLFVPIETILRCEADGNYTHFFLADGRDILVSKTLKEFDELLHEYGFFRVHHSHLVNLHHLTRYVRGDGGYVILADGSMVDVSRRKKDALMQHLQRP